MRAASDPLGVLAANLGVRRSEWVPERAKPATRKSSCTSSQPCRAIWGLLVITEVSQERLRVIPRAIFDGRRPLSRRPQVYGVHQGHLSVLAWSGVRLLLPGHTLTNSASIWTAFTGKPLSLGAPTCQSLNIPQPSSTSHMPQVSYACPYAEVVGSALDLGIRLQGLCSRHRDPQVLGSTLWVLRLRPLYSEKRCMQSWETSSAHYPPCSGYQLAEPEPPK